MGYGVLYTCKLGNFLSNDDGKIPVFHRIDDGEGYVDRHACVREIRVNYPTLSLSREHGYSG